jgi:hypothetical protein
MPDLNPSIPQGALTPEAVRKMMSGNLVPISASGAIDPSTAQRYIFTKATVAAMTLAAPRAGIDDGLQIQILSSNNQQHTITATGLFYDGAGHVNLATRAANNGGELDLIAYNGKWIVQNLQSVVMS